MSPGAGPPPMALGARPRRSSNTPSTATSRVFSAVSMSFFAASVAPTMTMLGVSFPSARQRLTAPHQIRCRLMRAAKAGQNHRASNGNEFRPPGAASSHRTSGAPVRPNAAATRSRWRGSFSRRAKP